MTIEDLWPVAGRTIIGTHRGEAISEHDLGVIVDGTSEVTVVRSFALLDDHPPGKVALLINEFGRLDGPVDDPSGGFGSIAIGVWYWLRGQPVADDDDNETTPE